MRKCPLCNSNQFSIFLKVDSRKNADGVEVRKCKKCRFVYSAEFSVPYTSLKGGHIDYSREQLLNAAEKLNFPLVVSDIVKMTKLASGKSLDFGCGMGYTSLCLQEVNFRTCGIELADAMRERHKLLNIKSAQNLELLGEEKGSFDLIVIKDVLEHVDFPEEIVGEIVPYLGENKFLYIRVPNVYAYFFEHSIPSMGHINHFTPKGLDELLTRHGLKRVGFIGVYDVKSTLGKLYNAIFYRMRHFLPLYHQISVMYRQIGG